MARETGATPEQIARAARSAVERLGKFRYPSWEESPPAYQRQWIEDIEMRARYLVRSDERIVSADDLRKILENVERGALLPSVVSSYDRLRAAIMVDVDAALEGSR